MHGSFHPTLDLALDNSGSVMLSPACIRISSDCVTLKVIVNVMMNESFTDISFAQLASA